MLLKWYSANQTKPTPAIWSENKTQQLKGCARRSTPRILNRYELKLVVGQLRWFEISRSLCLYLREDGLEWARKDFPNTLLTWCDKLICVNRTKTVGESVKSGNELGCVFLWGGTGFLLFSLDMIHFAKRSSSCAPLSAHRPTQKPGMFAIFQSFWLEGETS